MNLISTIKVAWYANETPELLEQTLSTWYRENTRLDTQFPRQNNAVTIGFLTTLKQS